MKGRSTSITALGVFTAVAASAAWPASVAAALYRCDGGVVAYSDRPCGEQAKALPPPMPAWDASDHPRVRREALENLQQLLELVRDDGDAQPATPRTRTRPQAIEVTLDRPPDCPSSDAIEKAIRQRRVLPCMTPGQVRRATPARIANHAVARSVDQFGTFVEWTYPVVTEGWPVRIQFRDGRVFGFETLPYRVRD